MKIDNAIHRFTVLTLKENMEELRKEVQEIQELINKAYKALDYLFRDGKREELKMKVDYWQERFEEAKTRLKLNDFNEENLKENMEITNKKVISDLQEYFIKQDPRVVARALAALMIDLNRMYFYDELPRKEKESLLYRCEKNAKALQKFAKEGDTGDLILHNLETKED